MDTREIKKIISKIKFKSVNLSFSQKLIIIGTILAIVSLFMPWVENIKESIKYNSFNNISWNIWYLLIFILVFNIFITISTTIKEKVKLYSDLSIKNHFFVISSSIFIIFFSIICISFVNWLNIFVENIKHGSGINLAITSWIIIMIWWFLLRKEYYENSSEIILDRLSQNREQTKEKNNMKLPF